jgi:hypothetical protein
MLVYSELFVVVCIAFGTAIFAALFLRTSRPLKRALSSSSGDPQCLLFEDGMPHHETTKDAIPIATPQDYPALKSCSETMAHPAWLTDQSGNIYWQNDAFTKLENRIKTPFKKTF